MAIFGRKRDEGPTAPAAEPAPANIPAARDSDIGVPPFRPASKDAPNMSLAPKPNATPAAPTVGVRPPVPVGVPARPAPRPDAGERRTLVVGRGISLQGTVADAERLVVEGTVESQMIQATELFVAQAGVCKGELQVEDAEIAGLFDGTITARNSLVIRATGRVNGVARCRKLSVEEGGQVSGRMEMLTEAQATAPATPRPVAPALGAPTPADA
jgi:cytoskeletal protein CcmA (bactofilin family)